MFYYLFLLLPLLPIQYKLSIQGNPPAKKHASKAQKVFSSKWLLSSLEQLVACLTSCHVLIACKCEDPAPAHSVSFPRASLPHRVLLQDFRMELEASFKFPWTCCALTAVLPKNKPCAQGSWFIAQQSSMVLLEEETVALKANQRGPPVLSSALSSRALCWAGRLPGPGKAAGQGKAETADRPLLPFTDFGNSLPAVLCRQHYLSMSLRAQNKMCAFETSPSLLPPC